MDEMKKLIIDGQEFEVVDAAGRQRITVLENTTPSGGGLSITEKNLILQLFNKAAYAEDDAGTAYTALSNLWTGSYHSVTWEGEGYTKGNSDVAVEDGESFTSTITANNGKTIESVTVTMGGETMQGAYSGGTITIPNVTGDIVITVVTEQMTVSSISAVYTQSGTVYNTDTLDSLKADLVVTGTFPDSSTAVIDAADYTLSGTLLVGTSTITVSYGGKTTSFNVTVTSNTGLYPLETGTTAFSNSDKVVSVYDGNIVHGINKSTGTGGDIHANISQVTLNTATANATANYSVATQKLFTIPSGATVIALVTPISLTYTDSNIGNKKMSLALRDQSAANLHVMLGDTAYSSLSVGTTVTTTFTAESDMDVWNIGMWLQGAYSRTVDIELELKLMVNDTRYI